MSVRDQFQNQNLESAKNTYDNVLEIVQQRVRNNYSELIANNDANQIKDRMIKIINTIINDEQLSVNELSQNELVDKIYDDMAGASFLNKYIYQTPNVEEVNINRWDDVTVTYSGGKPQKTPEQFSSPQQAVDIIKRLLQTQHLTIDDTTPQILSYLSDGVRICANIAPVVSKDAAVSASIRIVRTENVTMDSLKDFGTASDEMLNFLEMCIKNYVSVCISGSVGAGKTTTLSAILERAKDTDRVITIEEGSREFDLLKRTEDGKIKNNILSKLTRDSDDPKRVITQEDLLEHCLRENPDIMGIGEMRSSEAYTVAEAARTGTATYTTTHAKNARNTYKRLFELSYKKYPMELDFLMQQMVDAFPIIVFQKRFPDGSRRIVEICEGLYYDEKRKNVKCNTLYRYVVEDNIVDSKTGKITQVVGHFEKCNNISEELYNTFLSNGATTESLKPYFNKEEEGK